jgi:hypothetical protein
VCPCIVRARLTTDECAGEAIDVPEQELTKLRLQSKLLSDLKLLRQQHWDPEQQWFADWGLDTADVQLQRGVESEVCFQLNDSKMRTVSCIRHPFLMGG